MDDDSQQGATALHRGTSARVKEVATRAQASHGRLSAGAQRLVARQQYERMGTLMSSRAVNGS
jgi:hypothetical protein